MIFNIINNFSSINEYTASFKSQYMEKHSLGGFAEGRVEVDEVACFFVDIAAKYIKVVTVVKCVHAVPFLIGLTH